MNSQRQNLIIIVEDDPDVARTIDHVLREFSFETVCCRNAHELFRRLKTTTPDLCIIDLGLPDMDGLEVMQKVRSLCSCGIVILTGRTHVSDKVMGLELGADDYVIKPFEPRELVARIRSVLRRHVSPVPSAGDELRIAEFSGWRFDTRNNTLISPQGKEYLLSTAEAELLNILIANPNRIVHRDKLIGNRSLSSADRSIDVRMSRLRRKLEPDSDNPKMILTIYGAGYLLKSSVSWV
jgi:two-component system OmpR family response regulator